MEYKNHESPQTTGANMQFNCDAKELKAALANLKRVMANNNKIPVLNGVLLVANADTQTVKLTGTDLEVALSVDVLANVNTPGSTVIRRADLGGCELKCTK